MQNLHFQTSLLLGVPQKEVKFNTILMFTCGKNTLGIEHIIRI